MGVDTKPPFEILESPHRVELWLDSRLPFEPRGWHLEARGALRSALKTLAVPPAGTLCAAYTSTETSFCDVENVLFYNVGTGAFADLTRNGLRFERNFGSPSNSPSGRRYAHHHVYYSSSLVPGG